MITRVRALAIAVLCICACVCAPALAAAAADVPDGQRERAVELGREGIHLYNEGRFLEAYERFERAEAGVHSPVFVLYMARAQRQMGDLERALELYERVDREILPDDAPEAWRKANKDAGDELRLLRERIAEQQRREAERKAPPAPDAPPAPAPAQHPTAQGSGSLGYELPPLPPKPRRSRGAIALISVGAAVLAVGIATGIAALVIGRDLEDQCDSDNACHPDFEGDIRAFHGLGYFTTVALPLGAATAGGGILWFVLAGDGNADRNHPRVVLGPAGFRLEGRY